MDGQSAESEKSRKKSKGYMAISLCFRCEKLIRPTVYRRRETGMVASLRGSWLGFFFLLQRVFIEIIGDYLLRVLQARLLMGLDGGNPIIDL